MAFRAVSSQRLGTGADAVLVVDGEIVNTSTSERAVAQLEITVQSDNGQPIYTWTSAPPRQTLAATETARFRARLASPPPEGRRVLVRFGRGGGDLAPDTVLSRLETR